MTSRGWPSSLQGCSVFLFSFFFFFIVGFPDGSVVKKPPAGAGATAPFLGREDALEEQIHYSCLEHPMDRGAWRATVQAVAKSQTRP